MNPKDFVSEHLVEACGETSTGREFFPPVPIQGETLKCSQNGTSLVLELIPTLARITVELSRADQRRVHFQPGCPARLGLEKITNVNLLSCNTPAEQGRLIWLAKLARHALELADEFHQFDGQPCLEFAAGFIAGENSLQGLFDGADAEAAALESAIKNRFGVMAAGTGASRPFGLGFRTRRDQLRAARQAEIDSI